MQKTDELPLPISTCTKTEGEESVQQPIIILIFYLQTTSKGNWCFKSGAVQLYCSLVTYMYSSFRLTMYQIPIAHEENALTSLPHPYYPLSQ